MTADIIVAVVLSSLIIGVIIFSAFLFYIFEIKEYTTTRYPSLENKSMTKKVDKEINRLHKNYGELKRYKYKLEEQNQELEQQLDDIFFEIKALEDLKFKIEDNAQHDYLFWSVDDELKRCDRVKFKQQFRRFYETKNKDGELKPGDPVFLESIRFGSKQVADEDESEEDE